MSELETFLTGVADAIREKKGTRETIPAKSFANEIRSIEGGGGEKPTLNAPKIEFNANGGYMYILDGANGDFSEGYQLYLNGEENVILTSTNIKMQDYGITETDEIGIVAVGNLFNNSPMATARWSDLELGTIGLLYNANKWTGIGTATGKDIVVAGLVNGIAITGTNGFTFNATSYPQINDCKITLPEGMTTIAEYCFENAKNLTIIVGKSFTSFGTNVFRSGTGITLDLRKAERVVTIKLVAPIEKAIVPDEDYDEYIVATNWSAIASKIIKGSIYEAQQGGTV